MSLTNFGDMGAVAAGVGATGSKVSQALRELPIGEMIKAMAGQIAQAQLELDKAGLLALQTMASTTIDVIGEQKSMIELGFFPQFYVFQKATLEVSMQLKFAYEETQSVSLGVNANFGYSKDSTSGAPPASPAAPSPAAPSPAAPSPAAATP